MTITIELIDELKKRANVSFEDSKEALEKFDGNLVEALVYLEKNNKIKPNNIYGDNRFLDKVKALIRKGNNTRFIISKKEKTVLDLSVTTSVIIGAFTFHISAIALVIGLLTGYRFRFEKNTGEDIKANVVLNKMHDGVDNLKKKLDDDIAEK